ncbi:MAG: hypothetical protein ABSB28_01155 [Candidatus Bathyarchaeia archaeon]
MTKKLLSAIALVLFLAFATIRVEAYNPAYQIDAVHGSAPTIDGIINVGEWSDASVTSISNQTTVFVKQDGTSLYVAFNISDASVSLGYDGAAIYLDLENNGGPSVKSDDYMFATYRNGGLNEIHFPDGVTPPTGGWNALVSSTNTGWQAEFNITYSRLNVTAGVLKTIGIALESVDYPNLHYWPPEASYLPINPSSWGNLISTQDWIPEFTSIIILPLFMIATLLAIIIYRRKHTLATRAR